MKEVSLEEMLEAGVHFGHKVGRLYPKMKPFVFTSRNDVSIIDLEKTKENLTEAQDFVKKIAQKKGTVLFVGTKRQAQDIIKKYATGIKMPYVIERWIGGTFTNFSVILKMINKFKKLKEQRDTGELEKYTKKERLRINEEIERLDQLVGGIESLTKIPDAVYIVDLKSEITVVKEARKKRIPIIAVVDVNCNPEGITHPIPANDDATKSIDLLSSAIADAYSEGAKMPLPEKTQEKKEEVKPSKEEKKS